MARILIDTNVLVYPFDARDAEKAERAERVLAELRTSRLGFLSVQSLAEFMNSARKLGISPRNAAAYVEFYAASFTVLDMTTQIILEAARGVREYQLAYYDAQIWAAARLNQISVLFSEDFRDGTTLEGVCFVNPFGRDFAVSDWV